MTTRVTSRGRQHLRPGCVCQLVLATAFASWVLPAMADQAQDDEAALIANVEADGTLFGFALGCGVANEHLEKYLALKSKAAQEFARLKVPRYSGADFRKDFGAGVANANRLMGSVQKGSAAFESKCVPVRAKFLHAVEGT